MVSFYKNSSKVCRDKNLRFSFKFCAGHAFSLRCLNDSNFSKSTIGKTCFFRVVSLPKIRNKCLVSGKASSVFSEYRMSRLQFRSFALFGLLPGVLKALW
jgi:ribosomal protein S14